MNYKEEYEKQAKALQVRQIQYDLHKKEVDECVKNMNELKELMGICHEAFVFLETIALGKRAEVKLEIQEILTKAVQAIYGTDLRVELEYEVKNNRSNLEIMGVKKFGKEEVKRTLEGFGGSLSDTISVPLKLLVLIGSNKTDKVVVLDEAWKHMDLNRIDKVAEFLKDACDKMGLQVILLSHHEAFKEVASTTYHMLPDGKVTREY